MSAQERTFVIVGASMAGGKAAETLREEGFTDRVVLIGEETEPPYERPPLSKGYLIGNDPREQAFLREPGWWSEHGIELMLGRRATMLDAAAHTVTLDGVEELRYDKLLLATGSRVRELPVPGHDLHRVRYLRTLDESDALLADLRRADTRRLVVIGAGWIGMEAAAAARHHDVEVTVVDQDTLPLRRALGDQVARHYQQLHEAHGVRFRLGTQVRELRGEQGEVSAVVLADGTELPADVVLVGIGIVPATELAVAAGLTVDDGVVTDSGLRSSDPDVYACGDVARTPNSVAGAPVRLEHWAAALDGGPAAARSMLEQPVTFDPMPFFFTDQYDLGMELSGWPVGAEQVIFRGDPALVDGKVPEYVGFWLDQQSRVRAGMNVNVWDVADHIQALIRGGRPVDPARLADPAVPLDSLT